MRLNRKWLLAIALVLSLTMAISGTLAYLTDRDSKANVLTFGNVEIELIEEYEPESQFLPGVKVEKEASIKNVGDNDAYVWLTVAVPEQFVVYNPDKPTDASGQHLHWNVPGAFWNGYHTMQKYIDSAIAAGYLPEDSTGVHESDTWILYNGNVGVEPYVTEIDGANYCVSTLLYTGPIEKGETTNIGTSTFYLDQHIDITPDGEMYRVMNGVPTQLGWNVNTDGNPVVYISAYAIQAEGVTDVTKDDVIDVHDAYAMYKGQWGDKGAEYGKEEEETPSYPETTITVSSSEELAEAITANHTVIGLNSATYQIPAAAKGKTLALVGSGDDTVIEVVPAGQDEANGQLDYNFDGSTVSFYNLTIKTNSQTYAGYARLSGTYTDCVIQNTYNLGVGNSAFNNCTFNITNEYLRVGGAYSAVFDGCTFNTDGRAILVFQDGTSVAQTVTVKDCTFNATAAANTWNGIHVAAVSIDGSQGGTYTVNLEGTNTVDSDFNGLWQIKAGEASVTVNE